MPVPKVHSESPHTDTDRARTTRGSETLGSTPDRAAAGTTADQRTPTTLNLRHPGSVLALQRAVGNQRTGRLIRQRTRSGRVQRFGEQQHGGIEQEALAGSFTGEEQRDIAFGNWANDFNQISLAGDFIRNHTPLPVTNQDLFEIARIIAEVEFGARIARRMTPERFGAYDPQQHFDNPATDPMAAPDLEPVARHVVSARQRIENTLRDAAYEDDPAIAREFFGSGLHILEDFFAHTNFVEITLRMCGVQSIDPRPGTVAGADRNQLVGGIFATADTVVSVLHMIGNYLLRPAEPDQPITTGDRIALVLMRRASPALATAYERFCYLDFTARRMIPGYELIHQQVQQFKRLQAGLLGQAANAASALVTAQATGGGNLPTHSRLNKDDPSQPHYQLARTLAVHVVQQVTPLMQEVWRLRRAIPPTEPTYPESPAATPAMAEVQDAEARLQQVADQHTQHPDQGAWWRPIVEPHAARLRGGG